MRHKVEIAVYTGDFASQPLVFAYLWDRAEALNLSPDLDLVDVIHAPFEPRLRGYFEDDVSHEILKAEGSCRVLMLPGAGLPFEQAPRLTCLGLYPGWVTRPK